MPTTRAITRALLSFGVLYAVFYVIANDVIAASFTRGYSRVDQAVSELSATGAPAANFLRAMLPVFTALMLGFAVGVWRAAAGSRALQVTAALLLGSAVVGVAWLWFPMTSREQMAGGPLPANDIGHLVLSGLTVLLILLQMAFGAAAFGRSFRIFSVACAVMLLGFGAVMGLAAPTISEGGATPWMGLFERLMLAAWLGWQSVFANVLMRRERHVPG